MRRATVIVLGLMAAAASPAAQAQVPATFRVFLSDGRTLSSYGESTVVADRVVFMLPIGDLNAHFELQLMSLPASSVDVGRTIRYAESVRAAHFAATRGETDYAAVTSELAGALDNLTKLTDRKRRLTIAEDARRRLLAWAGTSYGYRAAEVQELLALFDEVIADLRVAAGEARFSLDFVAGPVVPRMEPLMQAPTLRESIAMALSAAGASDLAAERSAILRTAMASMDGVAGAEEIRASITEKLNDEVAADRAYASLSTELTARADTAARAGDVRAVTSILEELDARDRALGSRRPDEVRALLHKIEAKLEAARARRLALDHYALVRTSLIEYERRVRSTMTGLDALKGPLDAIRDMSGPDFDTLLAAQTRLARFKTTLDAITVPDDLRAVHATLVSSVNMASVACVRRKQAIIAPDMAVAREASAAASGAQLLLDQARRDLLAQMAPPKVQ